MKTLTQKQHRIVHAALCELHAKLSRGMANSGLEQSTATLLRASLHVHESEVQKLAEMFANEPWCVFCKRNHEGGDTCMGHYP